MEITFDVLQDCANTTVQIYRPRPLCICVIILNTALRAAVASNIHTTHPLTLQTARGVLRKMNANDGPADRTTTPSCISKWFVAQPPLENQTAEIREDENFQNVYAFKL